MVGISAKGRPAVTGGHNGKDLYAARDTGVVSVSTRDGEGGEARDLVIISSELEA